MLEEISKVFDISSSIIFHNFLPLHCEEILHVRVTLGQEFFRCDWCLYGARVEKLSAHKNARFGKAVV